MLQDIVLTVIGADRPGLVELVADRVAHHGGNWLESRMCQLGGQFAGIVRVQAPRDRVGELRKALEGLAAQGLRVTLEIGGGAPAAPGQAATLELVGNDRPGILKAVSGVLARHGVNVEELSSDCINAPLDGGQLFQARARVVVPASTTLAAVRADLERIAADLMVDVRIGRPLAK
ncbi:MAG TPA: ACT domain-containing protein [Opitutaceae bacterium]|nr:ACT domain-containing protein [Opitutaceae bacterium]